MPQCQGFCTISIGHRWMCHPWMSHPVKDAKGIQGPALLPFASTLEGLGILHMGSWALAVRRREC
jgi:hypothetical protein